MPKADETGLRDAFVNGMSHAAWTVTVVTTDGPQGRAGVTVSAMSSVSADTPRPTLLVCVHHLAGAATAIIGNGVLCVNVLRDDQALISDTFAGRHAQTFADRFDCAEWTSLATGAPRLLDSLVAFDCHLVSHQRVGTHYVLLGEVEEVFSSARGRPLIYANRSYLTSTQPAPSTR